ncbi:pyridoxal phosphate-dependent transferase [Rhodofomes roseus]|uniref:Pyridoxal phosphate-dependent transferase n=1 Tax=Rhodofomes roseus TaxID=34475 RepID=A0ABQ8KRA7_9APHY|nr:pyridoxal phosphate-dependent transferase [Rhodofomes roseus]KAH9841070.1 pyridoxal phosphate-dependent transferase [Rhodofomes roseus]
MRVSSPPARSPPDFGHTARQFFQLDPQYTNLNHGTAGAIPRHVEDATRQQVAELIGAETSECVFVPNVSHGINTVLRNFEWEDPDVLLVTNCSSKTISAVAQYISDTRPHPILSEFKLLFPETRSSILRRFRAHIRSLRSTSKTNAKVVAVFESISASPGVVMPWREMVQICKANDVWSVVDAAHSLGQERDIDLSSAAPDFWVSSCSKWMYAKHGCAVLYVPKRNHHVIKSAFPTSSTYDHPAQYEEELQLKFYWTGTLDFTAPLSIKAALEFSSFLGGEERINQYCHYLALAGGKRLAEVMNTHMLYPPEDPESELFTANMVNVVIPLSGLIQPSTRIIRMLQDGLLNRHNVSATQFYHNGKWWTRASVQVYNEVGDFDKLGHALLLVCTEIESVTSDLDTATTPVSSS